MITLIFFIIKNYKYKKRLKLEEDAVVAKNTAVPDIEDEGVTADQLHTSGWLEMAQDLEEGDPRLALRALYLASLSFLGERNLIHIASFKSNYEYPTRL